jgi:hypothetical protein
MMALDRGGQCQSVLYELPQRNLEGQFGKLFRREFTYKPANSIPRWIKVETASGVIPALAFVVNRASPRYVGGLSPDSVADVLARACGHWGTGAEYLLNTVVHLEKEGSGTAICGDFRRLSLSKSNHKNRSLRNAASIDPCASELAVIVRSPRFVAVLVRAPSVGFRPLSCSPFQVAGAKKRCSRASG